MMLKDYFENRITVITESVAIMLVASLAMSPAEGLVAIISQVSPIVVFAVVLRDQTTKAVNRYKKYLNSEESSFKYGIFKFFLSNDTKGTVESMSELFKQSRLEKLAAEESKNSVAELLSNLPGAAYQFCYSRGSVVIEFASDSLYSIHGIEKPDAGFGERDLMESIHEDDREAVSLAMKHSCDTLLPISIEYRVEIDGHTRWLYLSASPKDICTSRDTPLWHGFIIDITARKEDITHIENLAYHDYLTGLPNRRLLYARLTNAVTASSGCEPQSAMRYGVLMFIDLDRFKELNDTHGHEAGDQILVKVARKLKETLRKEDLVARIGGDEFVILLENFAASESEAGDRAKTLAAEILVAGDSIDLEMSGCLQEYAVRFSIGISVFLDNSEMNEVLKKADIALYEAKIERNTFRVFSQKLQNEIAARGYLKAELEKAVNNNALMVYYQPQVNSRGQVIGVEALVRWHHSEMGSVSPERFISQAEDSDLITRIDSFVLNTVCLQLKVWETDPKLSHLTVAVNISARHFKTLNFLPNLEKVLEETEANPTKLKLELTESVSHGSISSCIEKLTLIKQKGIAIEMDDFGTGYSSLSYLAILPIDGLKIDKSFVQNIGKDSKLNTIVDIIVLMGRNLGLYVIAEGVETQAQHAFLTKCAIVDACQGFMFSEPLPLNKLIAYMDSRSIYTIDTELPVDSIS